MILKQIFKFICCSSFQNKNHLSIHQFISFPLFQTYSEFVKYTQGTNISVANFSGEETDIGHADILVSTPNRIVFHLDKIDTSALRWGSLVFWKSGKIRENWKIINFRKKKFVVHIQILWFFELYFFNLKFSKFLKSWSFLWKFFFISEIYSHKTGFKKFLR